MPDTQGKVSPRGASLCLGNKNHMTQSFENVHWLVFNSKDDVKEVPRVGDANVPESVLAQ